MMTKSNSYHEPVLLQSCLNGLSIDPDGIYVDATFGGGGHAGRILSQLDGGKLIAFDQDEDARANLPEDDRLVFVPQNFRYLKRFLRLEGFDQVDGILADLGVSSHQFDTAGRGFSIRYDGPLDMRMDASTGESAADLLKRLDADSLQSILSEYGEVRNARTLAIEVVNAAKRTPIQTTADLVRIAEPMAIGPLPKYLAQIFQALRIAVNQEIDALKDFLRDSLEVLKPGGRLVIISYHSLEDRLVKNFMRWGGFEAEPEKDLYGNSPQPFKRITKKPISPSVEEIKINPRARSARLRIAEKK